jgi:SAM-dependent methyltransferase
LDLANRVGCLDSAPDPFEYYDELGHNARTDIVERLPADWTFTGKRILDFGCGAGRTLRHFASEADEAEIWGCDIDEASVSWMSEHLCPPFHVFQNASEPPLDQPDSSFDLIWGVSVFTHLTDTWSKWLVELHRVLSPDGLLFLTFMGSGMSELIIGEPWSERNIGMNVTKCGQSWDLGGPMVMHSPWWIEEHWGRGFEVLSLVPDGFASSSSVGQGSALMRKRSVSVDPELLERTSPGDEREMLALAHNLDQLQRESISLRRDREYLESLLAGSDERNHRLEEQLVDLERRLATIENSRSWNLTKPLRAAARKIRAATG